MSKRNQPEPRPQQPLQKTAGSAVQVSQSHVNVSSGPIPSPETLAHYERLFPGLGERIVGAFETEYRHRHHLAEMSMQGDIDAMKLTHRDHRLGQILGFFICIAAMSVGTFLVYNNHDWAGGTIGGLSLASVLAAYYRIQAKSEAAPKPD
jgi:uncharacterized membrane protein